MNLLRLLLLTTIASASVLTTINVSSQGTFLRQSGNDVCTFDSTAGCNMAPSIVDLNAFGLLPGDILTLTGGGTLCVSPTIPCHEASIGGIFSASSVILAPSFPNRILDSIYAGLPNIDSPALNTFFGNLPTMIPNDFFVSNAGTVVTIPQGAHFLIFGVLDSFEADNSGNMFVTIEATRPHSETPEPSTGALLLGGLISCILIRRKIYENN